MENLNAITFLNAYSSVYEIGDEVSPRGNLCKERTDFSLVFDLSSCPLSSFKARNLNLKYAKEELLWYLRADRYDTSIEKHASMWAKIKQIDGGYNSNYGQYIFRNRQNPYNGNPMGTQFEYVLKELLMDPDSRRASIVLLKDTHLYSENSDIVCTYAINFRIRKNTLHMTVMMRSNDLIFGTTNDAFCFWGIGQLLYWCLVAERPTLKMGTYTHFANSLHIYERHFKMVEQIIADGMSGYNPIAVPMMTPGEAQLLVASQGRSGPYGQFSEWLMS